MATLTALHSQWHAGEQAVQRMLGVPERNNPTVHGLKQAHGHRVQISPLVAFGTLDERGRPWVTVWGGEAGFCRPIAEDILGVNSITDARYDPVTQALFAEHDSRKPGNETESGEGRIVDGEVIKPENKKVMAALSVDLETRDRVKLAGQFIAGSATGTSPGLANLQLAFAIEEALGNCPKYMNKKHIVPHVPTPELSFRSVDSGASLPREALDLIAKADLFFLSSKSKDGGNMDVNHRGGAPGFLRVFRNQAGAASTNSDADAGIVLVYQEYSGNRLYQTLGNLREEPAVGLVVPDFETGDVLYLTGRTTILVGERAAAYMPRTKLAIRIDVAEAIFVRDGLPFRGSFIDHSPYNPPVRQLAVEKKRGASDEAEDAKNNGVAVATLLSGQVITPTVSRYVFGLAWNENKDKDKNLLRRAWHAGQHVTLDFAAELDHGYSHMRDEDPQSLNDDFVRTFTVSAPPKINSSESETELEIVVRQHGPATALLARWNPRAPLEIPVLGFGGGADFRMPVATNAEDGKQSVFVAGGVGITPLLAQAPGVLGPEMKKQGNLALLWSLRTEDLPLAVDAFNKINGLASVTRLFVTGSVDDGDVAQAAAAAAEVKKLGAVIVERRMDREDVLGAGEKGARKFFCCTGPAMMKHLLQWMEGEEVVFESFEY